MKTAEQIAKVYNDIMKLLEEAQMTSKEAIHMAKEIEVTAMIGIMNQIKRETQAPVEIKVPPIKPNEEKSEETSSKSS